MKRTLCLPIAAATLLASTAALADDPASSGNTSQPQQQTSQTGQATHSSQSSTQTVPTSTTQLTAADTNEPSTSIPTTTRPREQDTVTVYHTVRPNRPLMYTGGLLFVGTYATTAALTAANVEDGNADKTMYLPVVGPWLHLADIEEDTTDSLLIAGSGVLQGVGAGMFLASLFIPEKVPAATITAGNVKMNVTPTSYGRGSGGLAAVGTF